MRLVGGAVAGLAVAVFCAVVLGDYPITPAVMWVAALVIPALVGVTLTILIGDYQSMLWILTGPLSATAMAWGLRIATGWGLDPVPGFAWSAVTVALLWPPAWGLWSGRTKAAPTVPADEQPRPGLRLVPDDAAAPPED